MIIDKILLDFKHTFFNDFFFFFRNTFLGVGIKAPIFTYDTLKDR